MTYAVRYYSKSGNTRKVAEAIAEELGVKAISIEDQDAPVTEETDVLFIGGAVYAYGIDKSLSNYINSLDNKLVKKIAAFSTAMISRHALTLIKRGAQARDIKTVSETLFVSSKDVDESGEVAREFVRSVTGSAPELLMQCQC
ncbi:MAG: flavodoxin family protein [Saccharofermentans sp.]|nr:flavodoxin family protein [Saccharofermentans sp.]